MSLQYLPKVTIVIPVYNGEKFIRDAIDSALNQTYSNIEIIVINDGSTDNTDEIVQSYRDKIIYIKKDNGGVSSVLNLAIKEMTGEYLSWLSHDDKYLPKKIQRQVEKLNEIIFANASNMESIKNVVLYCSNERIDINGNVISRKKHIYKESESPVESMMNNIRHYNICGCAVLIPKKAFDDVGNFRVEIPTCSDADMWYRMMFAGYRFIFMNEVLVQSRQHQGQVSKEKEQQCKNELNSIHIEIAKKLVELLKNKDDIRKLGCYLLQRGFEPAAQLVFQIYENQYGKIGVFYKIEACTYYYKYKLRIIVRSVYRKLTSR